MKQHFSNKVSAFEAKTHYSELIKRTQAGEKITIMKHNTPVAVLSPIFTNAKSDTNTMMEDIRVFNKGKKLNGLSIKDLISEGRK